MDPLQQIPTVSYELWNHKVSMCRNYRVRLESSSWHSRATILQNMNSGVLALGAKKMAEGGIVWLHYGRWTWQITVIHLILYDHIGRDILVFCPGEAEIVPWLLDQVNACVGKCCRLETPFPHCCRLLTLGFPSIEQPWVPVYCSPIRS